MPTDTAGLLTIDLGAIADNWRSLRARHGADTAAVVKADAYGLGAAEVGRTLRDAGCRHFFVAHLVEGIILRDAIGPGPMIAVLNGFLPGADGDADLTPVLNTPEDVAAWGTAEVPAKGPHDAILHLDTGMNRLGLTARETVALGEDPAPLRRLHLRYVMTHLVMAEDPWHRLNGTQAARFAAARRRLPAMPGSIANSSGIFLGPGFASDLARPGCALYGINPTPGKPNPMQQVMTLEAPVLQVRTVPPGATVGYGAAWTAYRDTRIATVAAGYADGYLRALSNRAVARHRGRDVPLAGRVSMDLTTFDVTDHPDIQPGSLLTLIGPGLTPDDLAARAGTVGYEILTSLGSRYRRAHRPAP